MEDRKFWKSRWTSSKKLPPNNFAKRAYSLIKKKKFKTVLDVGAGNGRDSAFFLEKGLAVTAIDFSESGIEKIKSLNSEVKTYCTDIRKIKLPKNSFDVIYAHLSLHYFNDKETEKIFDNLYGILKKGGLIFVKCKSIDDALYGKGKKMGEDMYIKDHMRHFFSKDYMTDKMRKFKNVKVRKTSSVYHSYKSDFIEAVASK